ncbi:hypothetical protein Tco_0373797 [Tanacetum coccineum]
MYSIVDACHEMHVKCGKPFERNRGKTIVTSSAPTYDPEPDTVTEDDEMSKDKEIDNHGFNFSLRPLGYDTQRAVNVAGARENVDDWNDDTDDDRLEDQNWKHIILYWPQTSEVTPDPVGQF